MATMRSGLETWLKQECFDNGMAMIDVRAMLREFNYYLDPASYDVRKADEWLQKSRLELQSVKPKYYDWQKIIPLIDRLLGRLRQPDLWNNPNEFNLDLDDISLATQITDTVSKDILESVVECQCGRQIAEFASETAQSWDRANEDIRRLWLNKVDWPLAYMDNKWSDLPGQLQFELTEHQL